MGVVRRNFNVQVTFCPLNPSGLPPAVAPRPSSSTVIIFPPLYLPYLCPFAFHLLYCVLNLRDLSRERERASFCLLLLFDHLSNCHSDFWWSIFNFYNVGIFWTRFFVCISLLGFLDLPWIFACSLSVFNFQTLAHSIGRRHQIGKKGYRYIQQNGKPIQEAKGELGWLRKLGKVRC